MDLGTHGTAQHSAVAKLEACGLLKVLLKQHRATACAESGREERCAGEHAMLQNTADMACLQQLHQLRNDYKACRWPCILQC